jgi:hypothetical protein
MILLMEASEQRTAVNSSQAAFISRSRLDSGSRKKVSDGKKKTSFSDGDKLSCDSMSLYKKWKGQSRKKEIS